MPIPVRKAARTAAGAIGGFLHRAVSREEAKKHQLAGLQRKNAKRERIAKLDAAIKTAKAKGK